MTYKSRLPLTLKLVFSLFPIILIIGVFIYLHLRSLQLTKQFYNMEINSVVVQRSDWKRSSIDFHLENGVVLTFLAPAERTLEIGDSIRKVSNSYKYDVYRRDLTNEYQLIKSYDYRHREY